jgi:hypothetical protein
MFCIAQIVSTWRSKAFAAAFPSSSHAAVQCKRGKTCDARAGSPPDICPHDVSDVPHHLSKSDGVEIRIAKISEQPNHEPVALNGKENSG